MDDLVNSKVEVRAEKPLSTLSVKFIAYMEYPEFLKTVEHEYQLIRLHQLQKCVIDLRSFPVYPNGAPEYVKDTWFPTVSKLGIKHIAFVVPESVLGQMSMNKAHQESQSVGGISVKHFSDSASANAWLKAR
jgi:hypothetical protein